MSFPYGPHCLEQTAYKPQGILHIPYFRHDHAPEILLQKMPDWEALPKTWQYSPSP